jgi:uncharacterized iron-regulated membrane protein
MAIPRLIRVPLLWAHLLTGVIIGLVVLVLALTGTVLALRPKVAAWIESTDYPVTPTAAGRLPPSVLVARTLAARPSDLVSKITLRPDATAPAKLELIPSTPTGDRYLYVDPYRGTILGGTSERQLFWSTVHQEALNWHVRLGEIRPWGKKGGSRIVAVSNAMALFLVMSGLFLWLPARWTRKTLRSVTVPKWGRPGKARHFNWHNALGLWTAPVLFVLVATGVFLSFDWPGRWANALWAGDTRSAFQAFIGRDPPSKPKASRPRSKPNAARAQSQSELEERRLRMQRSRARRRLEQQRKQQAMRELTPPWLERRDALWTRAVQEVPGWQAVTISVPPNPSLLARAEHADFWVADGSDVTTILQLAIGTGDVIKSTSRETAKKLDLTKEPFSGNTMEAIHTGRVGGTLWLTLITLASLTTAVLVWTGLNLTCRRWLAWRGRRAREVVS